MGQGVSKRQGASDSSITDVRLTPDRRVVDMPSALEALGRAADHSWLEHLTPDPEADKYAPNKKSRPVKSGHFVKVLPTPLPRPKLVIHSPPMAEALGITMEEVDSENFVNFFAGDQSRVPALQSWCTPYALSIMGQPYSHNCPFGDGTGYGDGRAVSVGEVVVTGQRWEMQLKGGGTTPFCRGADGRAVLRSSIREFLASEAMHHLGVGTTRALSLVVSGSETSQRPWYSNRGRSFGNDPDTTIVEPCAITTRVAPSFLRVGHVDLFARRALAERTPARRRELEQIVEHALLREYSDAAPGEPLATRAAAMLEAAAHRLGAMVAGWLRVGFCQGNFNGDNCLVGGRTMDYGPFGWMDKYDPNFAKWVGSGQHFAFMNQPKAAVANYATLVKAVCPVFSDDPTEMMEKAEEFLNKGNAHMTSVAKDVWRAKMGFASVCSPQNSISAELWQDLEPLMRRSHVDYTLFWRLLAQVAEMPAGSEETMLEPLHEAFYQPLAARQQEQWREWLRRWRDALAAEDSGGGLPAAAARMRAVNPKYVPRESMLAEAYDRAGLGDFGVLHELYALFSRPYDEQPEMEAKYFRRAPDEALTKGGIAHMS